tara:strand:- start:4047 stop:4247 length:201 start_codon:yes stop_codon:yes gene_type:complete
METDNTTSYIGIRIPADLKSRLDTVCQEQERSMTSVCKIFLEKGVDTYDPNNFLPKGVDTNDKSND